jgi:hemoglobin/transferrin/lactoferrin receptor protein
MHLAVPLHDNKKSKVLDEVQNKWTGAVNMRYSTINQEQSIALNLNYAQKNLPL